MLGAEHERVGVGLYTESLVKFSSIPSHSYKPLMGLDAARPGVSDSVPKRPVRLSLGPDRTDGSTRKGARDGRVSWRPSRRQPGTDWRGLRVSQVAQFPGNSG